MDGEWRTIRGVHVLIGKDGSILKGPKALQKSDIQSKLKKQLKGKNENKEEKANKIRKPEDITKEELEEIKKIADIRDEDGFKQGIEKAVFDKYKMNEKHPIKVSKEEFEKDKGKKIYRGIGANSQEDATKYMKDFTDGEIYTGYNNSGSGTWFTENAGIADSYKEGSGGTSIKNGSHSFVIESKISENAKIIKASDLPSKMDRIKMYGLENDKQLAKIVYDDGLYATMLGYDVLETQVGFTIKSSNYSVLNRSVLKVKK
jgi:hypothetical protein